MKNDFVLYRTAILMLIAGMSALMWLFPNEEKLEELRSFYALWWEGEDTLKVNFLDSTTVYQLPLSSAARRSLWYRNSHRWSISNADELQQLPGMDSLWVGAGQFDFAQRPRPKNNRNYAPPSKPSTFNRWEREERPKASPVDVNTADSISLVAIPGIGPWTAKSILRERERWGYIADTSQLHVLYGLRDRWRPEFDTLLQVHPRKPTLSLNESPLDSLREFRGLRYAQVKKIEFWRTNFGHLTWADVAQWEEFNGVDLDFLRLYVAE